jgi:hypothetical protein
VTKVGTEKIKREKGYLYYVKADGYVWASPMPSNPHGKVHRVSQQKIDYQKGAMYYLGKEGYVEMRKR